MLQVVRKYFNALPDKENERQTVKQIEEGVSFRGANLWVLIFAILIASLGLNVNSTAVIIGAMLISPLMGPILGMGLGIGILDFELLKRSARNYGVATLISILTATFYFLLTPLTEAQSELLARTSPTLYDVLIALSGGAAGIMALSTRGNANVIPGVAIATALMPPLCTAGYGLATAQWAYFAGAFYLFFINTVMIALATFIGVRALRFHRRQFVDEKRLHRVQRYIWSIVVLTMVPATIMTFNIVRSSVRENNVKRFVQTELKQDGTQVLSTDIDREDSVLQVVAIGREIAANAQEAAQVRMERYGLDGYRLEIIQGTQSDSLLQLGQVGIQNDAATNEKLLAQSTQIRTLEQQLDTYLELEKLTEEVAQEMRPLYPQVAQLSLVRGVVAATDSVNVRSGVLAILQLKNGERLQAQDRERLAQWLAQRTRQERVRLVIED